MSVFLVTYELKAPAGNHSAVHRYLSQFQGCKRSDNVWLIDTGCEAVQIRRDIIPLLDPADAVFVAQIQPHWASYNFGAAEWLRDPARNW